MRKFVDHARYSIPDALLREQEEVDSLAFVEWTTNFGMDFWSFVMIFLAGSRARPIIKESM